MPYHQFHDDEGFNDYGSFETFWRPGNTADWPDRGWYWWPAFPGCLPDGDASGPFETEKAAIEDAQTTNA